MYEDEFELTFNLSGEEPQPEQAAQEPPVPPKPKAASPVVDEPTRVMVLEKPQPAPQPEMPESVQEEPEKTPAPTVQAAANGRCVLISGGDRGIGAAAARAFYAAGYRVAVLYHSNAKAAAELEKQLPGITAVQCDVASRASCELAFRTAEQALGRVDVLVSNAGIAQLFHLGLRQVVDAFFQLGNGGFGPIAHALGKLFLRKAQFFAAQMQTGRKLRHAKPL